MATSAARQSLTVDGNATLYRLYDVGYAIALDAVARLLGDSTVGRVRPMREQARAIEIRNPPLFVPLGELDVGIDATTYRAVLAANLFDFGVCSVHVRVEAPPGLDWDAFAAFANGLDRAAALPPLIARELDRLLKRISPAIERPSLAPVSEEYTVYRIDRVDGVAGATMTDVFTEARLVPLLVGETRPVSAAARRELIPHRFSYYDDDLTVLSWERALVVEPRRADRDVEYVLEFANAQLLELRMFDQQLHAELPALYDRVAAARARRRPLWSSRFRGVLSDLQTRVADITETAERVENALKVTNDVYLARIYAAALELFREHAWRRGIERKLGILRDTYTMLNAEGQAARAELLELAIVVLIVVELVLGLLARRP